MICERKESEGKILKTTLLFRRVQQTNICHDTVPATRIKQEEEHCDSWVYFRWDCSHVRMCAWRSVDISAHLPWHVARYGTLRTYASCAYECIARYGTTAFRVKERKMRACLIRARTFTSPSHSLSQHFDNDDAQAHTHTVGWNQYQRVTNSRTRNRFDAAHRSHHKTNRSHATPTKKKIISKPNRTNEFNASKKHRLAEFRLSREQTQKTHIHMVETVQLYWRWKITRCLSFIQYKACCLLHTLSITSRSRSTWVLYTNFIGATHRQRTKYR